MQTRRSTGADTDDLSVCTEIVSELNDVLLQSKCVAVAVGDARSCLQLLEVARERRAIIIMRGQNGLSLEARKHTLALLSDTLHGTMHIRVTERVANKLLDAVEDLHNHLVSQAILGLVRGRATF